MANLSERSMRKNSRMKRFTTIVWHNYGTGACQKIAFYYAGPLVAHKFFAPYRMRMPGGRRLKANEPLRCGSCGQTIMVMHGDGKLYCYSGPFPNDLSREYGWDSGEKR